MNAVLAIVAAVLEILKGIVAGRARERDREDGRNQVRADALRIQAEKADEAARIAARRDTPGRLAERLRDGSF